MKEALTIALGQAQDALIVVIDNASTDGTREYMSSVEDPRVTYAADNTGRLSRKVSCAKAMQRN
ncbi:MAG: hypothetical protein M1377_06715 [Deltaproteobacteria bacterium]|nr:hypothetical protein [Deltaproteobacteria bacterium]